MAIVIAVALAVRLLLVPYASQDTNDHASRIFIAWRWAEEPFLFLHGRWPTLHFMLVGPVIRLFDDPLRAPVLLHVFIGSLLPGVLYAFTAREFRVARAALAVGLCVALYPIAVRTSLEVLAQAPFSLCLALTLLALSKAREADASSGYAIAAGIALTLGTQLRTEGWALIPLFALTLWPHRHKMLLFAAVAAVGPVAAMVANGLYYGQPLFPLTEASDIMRNDVGAAHFSFADRIHQPLALLSGFVTGMTPLFALCAGIGAVACVVRRQTQARWLIPFAGVAVLMALAAAAGTLIPKAIYTESLGVLLAPFLAPFLISAPVSSSPRLERGIYAVLIGSMVAFVIVGAVRSIPDATHLRRLVAWVPNLAETPLPTFTSKADADRLAAIVRSHAKPHDAVIIDNLRSPATYYLGLHSGMQPDRVYLASGQAAVPLDDRLEADSRPLRLRAQPLRGTEPADIEGFMRQHCTGLLVLQPGSRFSAWMGFQPPDRIARDGLKVQLQEIAREPWALPSDRRLLAPQIEASTSGEVVVFRYAVTPAACAETAARRESMPRS